MNLFDIVGPVMVGPSSSHTAGAVRIGQVSRHLLGESVKEAKILLHGSFLATGKGHGTDKAIILRCLDVHFLIESFQSQISLLILLQCQNCLESECHRLPCQVILPLMLCRRIRKKS